MEVNQTKEMQLVITRKEYPTLVQALRELHRQCEATLKAVEEEKPEGYEEHLDTLTGEAEAAAALLAKVEKTMEDSGMFKGLCEG